MIDRRACPAIIGRRKGDFTMKHNFKFSANTLTVNGKSWPVEYIPDPSGALLLFVTVDENDADNDAIIVIKPEDSLFAAASAAANAEQTEEAPEAVETVQPVEEAEQAEEAPEAVETVQPVEEAEQAEEAPEAVETVQPVEEAEQTEEAPEAAETVQPAEEAEQAEESPAEPDPKQAHGPIPEKTFIGTEIPLPCGKVLFDPETERTRIILNDSPAADVVEKVKAAGFFYSPRTKSYNKKLTFRAYRAAVKLAAELNAA